MTYGFIITRHVNSHKTNYYWNQCVKLINHFYPLKQIIIIDDNSNQELVYSYDEYHNLTIIKSEWPGRGELLPYIYFLKYKWFDSAVILHDSIFIHKRIAFENIGADVLPLWHHKYDQENKLNLLRIASVLTNNYTTLKLINGSEADMFNFAKPVHNLCFGAQCFIKLSFLDKLQKKYTITNLVNTIYNRSDRCGFERVIGIIFCEEYLNFIKIKSLFGDIFKEYKALKYTYEEYMNDFNKGIIRSAFVKVWTGR